MAAGYELILQHLKVHTVVKTICTHVNRFTVKCVSESSGRRRGQVSGGNALHHAAAENRKFTGFYSLPG